MIPNKGKSADISHRQSCRKVNIAFINLPGNWKSIEMLQSSATFHVKQVFDPYGLPLGILYLSSYLKKYSDKVGKVAIIDYQSEVQNSHQYKDLNDFIARIATKEPLNKSASL